jgi:Cu(I)/Ag(I) efflux system protein CusF
MRKTMIIVTIALGLSISSLAAQSPMIEGQVMKVNESAGKITIKHGPIKKLDMDEGMTMIFKAEDPDMLKMVKPGDKIKFDPESVNGQLTVMKIEMSE